MQNQRLQSSARTRIVSSLYASSALRLLTFAATGGKCIGDKGYFIEPTVFADVKDDMKIAQVTAALCAGVIDRARAPLPVPLITSTVHESHDHHLKHHVVGPQRQRPVPVAVREPHLNNFSDRDGDNIL